MKWTPQKQNHVGVGSLRPEAETEGVAHKIRHVLQLRDLIIVRENDGIPLPLELEQLFGKIDTEIYTGAYH